MKKNDTLYILCDGRVAAIDKKTGEIKWEVKIKEYVKGAMSFSIGQLMVDGDKLFIGSSGILLCLQAKDGSFLWKNELKGWGYGFISMGDIHNESLQAAQAASAQHAANMAATAAGS